MFGYASKPNTSAYAIHSSMLHNQKWSRTTGHPTNQKPLELFAWLRRTAIKLMRKNDSFYHMMLKLVSFTCLKGFLWCHPFISKFTYMWTKRSCEFFFQTTFHVVFNCFHIHFSYILHAFNTFAPGSEKEAVACLQCSQKLYYFFPKMVVLSL